MGWCRVGGGRLLRDVSDVEVWRPVLGLKSATGDF